MHETAVRLYEAAKALKGISEPTALARAMHISPQALNNWERRGISAEGILAAEEFIGCESLWLKSGRGDMRCVAATGGTLAESEGDGYRVIPDSTISAVVIGIQSVLRAAGLPREQLGDRKTLAAAIRGTPASFDETTIVEELTEMLAESKDSIPSVSPEFVADIFLKRLRQAIKSSTPKSRTKPVK